MRPSLETTIDMTEDDLMADDDMLEVDDIAALDLPADPAQAKAGKKLAPRDTSEDVEIELSSADMDALLGNDAEIASVKLG